MKARHLALAGLATLTAGACGALLTGVSWVDTELPGGLPAGNLLAALVLVGTAALAAAIAVPRGPLRAAATVALLLSLAWLPTSVALAGNAALNFSGSLGDTWLTASLALLAADLGLLLAAVSAAAWRRLRRAPVAAEGVQSGSRIR